MSASMLLQAARVVRGQTMAPRKNPRSLFSDLTGLKRVSVDSRFVEAFGITANQLGCASGPSAPQSRLSRPDSARVGVIASSDPLAPFGLDRTAFEETRPLRNARASPFEPPPTRCSQDDGKNERVWGSSAAYEVWRSGSAQVPSRPTAAFASGCRTAKVRAAPGSGTQGEQAAADVNEITEEELEELYQEYLEGLLDNAWVDRSWHIPEPEDWGNPDCVPKGDDLALPGLVAREMSDLCSSDGPAPFVHNPCDSAGLTEIIEAAWCMLQDNEDLIEPVCELVFGKSGSCISNRIFRSTSRVEFNCTDADAKGWWFFNNAHPCPNIAVSGPDATGGFIHFCTIDDHVIDYLRVFGSGGDDDRLCVIVDMCATIFHEMTHVCLLNISDGDSSDACRTSYLAENTFKWLLLKRYPDALKSSCCAGAYAATSTGVPVLDDGLFMSDRSTTMTGSCA